MRSDVPPLMTSFLNELQDPTGQNRRAAAAYLDATYIDIEKLSDIGRHMVQSENCQHNQGARIHILQITISREEWLLGKK